MNHGDQARRRGSATVVSLIALILIAGLAAMVLSVSTRSSGEVSAAVDRTRAFLAAESGISQAILNLRFGDASDIGDANAPVVLSGGRYWVSVTDTGDGTFTLRSEGRAGLERQAIEVVVLRLEGGVFYNGIFAGNSSLDPTYTLELGGVGVEADEIYGDIYSGGDVELLGDAMVDGTVRASGAIRGGSGETGVTQPIPDLAGMDYPATADIKVAQNFATATYENDDAGGLAWQLPEDDPAHIFRRNPSDRLLETLATAKEDYFLEDPYEPVGIDPDQDGSDPYSISLSGVSGEPGPDSNRKVFFIDGNLWLHNYRSYSFEFSHQESSGVQVTFVVQGNIYFSDNLFYENAVKDGVAFIAIRDANVADSGNIYWGDPEFGTLKSMSAFMYAEDDFYDYNLGASGSTSIHLFGNMTAGDQLIIERDYMVSLNPHHTKLTVDFDERIANGELDMPGIPSLQEDEDVFQVLSWRKASPE